jgi:predicted dehydrogenase
MKSFLWHDRVQVVAVCDVDRGHRDDAKETAEKHYAEHKPSGEFKGIDTYGDFREVLARDDIDVVTIATPDHWHAPIAIAAAKAGKDMYCEKPLTRTIAEGRALSDTVRRTGRVLQVGSQQRSDRRFRLACELVRNGRIGSLHTIRVYLPGGDETGLHPPAPVPEGFDYDFWLGPAPWAPYAKERCHYNWRHQWDYAGGKLADWGAHHLDIAHWGMGMERSGPVEISGTGEWPKEGLWNMPVHYEVTYKYTNGVTVIAKDRADYGVSFEGSDGKVWVSREELRTEPASLAKTRFGPGDVRLYESTWHHGNFIDCVRTRREPIAPAEIGHRSASVCHLGNIALKLGRRLHWDPDRERFVNDPEADRLLARANRAPWRT